MMNVSRVAAGLIVLVSLAHAQGRSKEIGVIDYMAKYTEPRSKAACVNYRDSCYKAVQEAGLTPDWVDVDIFLRKSKKERDAYKRILIPAGTNWFMEEMYEGMDDYVRSGGLLITNSSFILLDANRNYKVDDEDGTTDYPQQNFLGVHGHAGCLMKRIKVLLECPLTKGIEPKTWLALGKTVTGRSTRNLSADVVILSDREVRGEAKGEQPFLTFKHIRHGACIYLVGQIGPEPDKTMCQIIRNICSRETLEWLCLQE